MGRKPVKKRGGIKVVAGVKVDPEFQKLCPALRDEELELLTASLKSEGCLDPICVWVDPTDLDATEWVIDGHNRFMYCEQYGVPFRTREIKLPDRHAVLNWIINHQLGRRNLTREQADYLRGQRYHAEKMEPHRPQNNSVKSTELSTAARIAEETGVSASKVEKDAAYAENIDAVAEKGGTELRDALLSGEVRATKAEVEALAEAPASVVRRVAAKVEDGEVKRLSDAMPEKKEPKPEGLVDGLKRPVPDKLAPAFEARTQFLAIRTAINAVARLIESLGEVEAGAFINVQSVTTELNNAKRGVMQCEPYTTCPYCKGHRCAACKKTGWVPRHIYDQAPSEKR